MDNFILQHVFNLTTQASQSVLDLIFSTIATTVQTLEVGEYFDSSDHAIV